MAVTSLLAGGVTDTAAVVVAHVPAATSCRIAVSTSAAMTSPTFTGPVTSSANGRARFTVTGLSANTRYYYRIEEAGTIDTARTGTFRTDPTAAGDPASFGIAFSSCAPGSGNGASNHLVHTRIKDKADAGTILAFAHLGDLGYPNIATNDATLFLANYAAQVAPANARALYESVPLVYVWDDHDFGPDNSDGTAAGKVAAAAAYREAIPSYPLVQSSGPTYRAFTKGRVRFVVTDQRYDRTPYGAADVAGKTILGAAQMAWFKAELTAAQADPDIALIVWASSQVPHFGRTVDPNWGAYRTERTEIWNHLATGGIDKLAVISGDIHAMAYETNVDLSTAQTAPVNVYVASPLENAAGLDLDGTHRWGGWSGGGGYGAYGQYATMIVDDQTTHINVTVNFYNVATDGTERLYFSHSFTKGDPPTAPGFYALRGLDGTRRYITVGGQKRMVHLA